jgi:ABC-type multidrug transport system ATPase subunit
MDLEGMNGYNLRGLSRKNILLGKNGCGKSRLLKLTDQALRGRPNSGAIRYLSPERGGLLQYEANIEQNLSTNDSWLADTRRQNQAGQFRQQSAAQFRRLELLTLREIEQTPTLRLDPSVTFDQTVQRINTLLDRVYVTRADPAFRINDRGTDARVQPQDISSGESELMSLGIECLVFEKEAVAGKLNMLLIDEPDVHLHPDLQARFAQFVEAMVARSDVTVLIATHSTALLGAMSDEPETHLAFMRYGEVNLDFSQATDARRRVLPVFGAHPLSNVFNQAPVLLLEGEDDERIWQQVVRSARGRVKVYPCAVDGLPELRAFEKEVSKILLAVYDNAIGYSLRDRDLDPTEIGDIGPVRRMRLQCRAAENLLLTDDVLSMLGVEWEELRGRIDTWLANNSTHPHHSAMKSFAEGGYNRADGDVKEIRNDLVGLMGTNKPWEVIVGQAIASQRSSTGVSEASMASFLGSLVCQRLLGLPPHVATSQQTA